jgi:hypothetical protein
MKRSPSKELEKQLQDQDKRHEEANDERFSDLSFLSTFSFGCCPRVTVVGSVLVRGGGPPSYFF